VGDTIIRNYEALVRLARLRPGKGLPMPASPPLTCTFKAANFLLGVPVELTTSSV